MYNITANSTYVAIEIIADKIQYSLCASKQATAKTSMSLDPSANVTITSMSLDPSADVTITSAYSEASEAGIVGTPEAELHKKVSTWRPLKLIEVVILLLVVVGFFSLYLLPAIYFIVNPSFPVCPTSLVPCSIAFLIVSLDRRQISSLRI